MKIKDKILSETSEEVKQRVRDTANKLVMKQETLEEEIYFDFTGELDGLPNLSDVIKEKFLKEDPEQETFEEVEEAALKYNEQFVGGQESRYAAEDFINGAKWQQERSYSEKEVLAMLLIKHDGLSPDYVLEQFKKK
jgi:hypothetical protein